jgi:hypothetical protein
LTKGTAKMPASAVPPNRTERRSSFAIVLSSKSMRVS